jgi:hypothetical protein
MGRRTDTRTSPLQGRDRLAPSQMTRLGNGFRTDGLMVPPTSESDGVPVIDWSSVHLITYADSAAFHDLVAIVRPWRYYSKQRDGQSGAAGTEVGRWIPDFHVTVALDPDRIDHSISSQYAWETRDAEKMFWQVIAVKDAAGNAPAAMPWIVLQPFGYTHKDDPFGVSVSTSSGNGGGTDPDCCPPEFTRMASVKATHWSPNDGTVVFTTGVTLTASLFPFTVANASCFISGIAVRKASGQVVEYINGHDGVSISAAANVITIAGALGTPFANTDLNYYVYIVYQDKGALAPTLWAVKATHWSPANGSSTRLAGTTLTTAGFPFVVDDVNCTILGVVVRRGAGAIDEYINGQLGYTLSATADVVTLAGAGASPFLGTDSDVYIYILYEEKAYTEATDSYRSEEIAPLNGKYTQPAYIYNDLAIVGVGPILIPSADGVVMDGYKDIQFQLHLLGGTTDAGANCVATLKFQGSNDLDAGAGREWVDLAVGYDLGSDSTQASWTSTGLTATDAEVDFDNWMGKRIRGYLTFDVAPEANHPGACVVTERRKAL